MISSIIELTCIYAIVTLGAVYSFRMIGFADLTIESSFTTGAAVSAVLITQTAIPPMFTVLFSLLIGAIAGLGTALLHVKGKISKLLSGIIMMTVLYSVNLQIMGRSNIQLLNQITLFNREYAVINLIVLLSITVLLFGITFLFLRSHLGYLIRTCGENPNVLKNLGCRKNGFIVLTLMISNGLTACAGALAAQYFGYADISLGTGLIVVVLAALILGEAIIAPRSLLRLLIAAFIGTLLYRLAFEMGLRLNIHPWNLKIAVGVFLAVALIVRRLLNRKRGKLFVGVDAI